MSINCYGDTKLRNMKKLKSAMITIGQYGISILKISLENERDSESIIRNKILTIVRPFGNISR